MVLSLNGFLGSRWMLKATISLIAEAYVHKSVVTVPWKSPPPPQGPYPKKYSRAQRWLSTAQEPSVLFTILAVRFLLLPDCDIFCKAGSNPITFVVLCCPKDLGKCQLQQPQQHLSIQLTFRHFGEELRIVKNCIGKITN